MTAFVYLLSRFFNAVAEARMRQAEIEVRKHLSLVPRSTLAKAGVKATYDDSGTLPFVK
ncbi:MAG TPA: hypothetical protein VIH65_03905 [Xanthobacteraceae bacterium]